MPVTTPPRRRTMPAAAPGRRRAAVAAAVSTGIAPILLRPSSPARVLICTPHAVYLRSPTGDVVAVVDEDAVRVPCALAIHGTLPSVGPDDDCRIGDNAVVLGGTVITIGRWWSPAIPVRGTDPAPMALRALQAVAAASYAARDGIRTRWLDAARRGDIATGRTLVDGLLGAGLGLTPEGDDVLAGAIVTWATGPQPTTWQRAMSHHALGLLDRTTAVSAALLRHAARGEAIGEVRTLLAGLDAGRLDESVIGDLLAVGHTSGPALLRGIALAFEAAPHLREAS